MYKSSSTLFQGSACGTVCVWRASVSDNTVVVYEFYGFGFLAMLLLFILSPDVASRLGPAVCRNIAFTRLRFELFKFVDIGRNNKYCYKHLKLSPYIFMIFSRKKVSIFITKYIFFPFFPPCILTAAQLILVNLQKGQ